MLKCALGFNKVRSLTPNCLLGSLVHGQQPLDVSYYPVPKLRTRTGLSGCQSYGSGLVIKLVGSWGRGWRQRRRKPAHAQGSARCFALGSLLVSVIGALCS